MTSRADIVALLERWLDVFSGGPHIDPTLANDSRAFIEHLDSGGDSVSVPREATDAMLDAMTCKTDLTSPLLEEGEYSTEEFRKEMRSEFRLAWKAALAASPAPARADPVSEERDAAFTIRIEPRPDGGLRVSSDDVRGLILSGPDPTVVMAKVLPAVAAIRLPPAPKETK